MKTLTVPEFHAELDVQKAAGISRREDLAFVCPVCGTVQSGADWMQATGKTFEEIENKLGFSCIGRGTNAGPFKSGAAAGRGCDWSLGGLFRLHNLEVVDAEGERHPMFEVATADQALALADRAKAGAA